MLKRLVISAVLVLAIAVPVVGCGDDSEAESSTASIETSSLSKAEYVEQADQRCARERQAALRELVAFGKWAGRPGGAGEGKPAATFEAASLRILAPSLERQTEAIRSLGAPSGDEQQIEALLDEMEQASAALVEDPPTRDVSYAERLQQAADLARQYGFEECASTLLI